MKLLIQKDLAYAWTAPKDLTSEGLAHTLEYFHDLEQLAKKYAVSRKFVFGPTSVTIDISAQKITLDQFDMNTLFADFLTELFEVQIRYAALGGAGCDFSMEIVSAAPRNLD